MDPFRDLMSLRDQIGRLFSETAGRLSDDLFGAWVPPVDIFEKEDRLVLRADLPGLDRDQIVVRVDNGALVLEGERKREEDVDETAAFRLERNMGPFTRSFTLPTSVDASKITARYTNGVLEVILPKAEEAKPKRIQIHGA
jgi:HSP20 family protein